jgi:PAP2 superfamily
MENIYSPEWLSLGYFLFITIFSRLRPLTGFQKIRILQIGVTGILLLIVTVVMDEVLRSSFTRLFRNLLPALLMVLAYWQSGNFYIGPNERLQQKLLELDNKIARLFGNLYYGKAWKKWMDAYLEFAYLFCYPMVPLGVVVFYLMKLEPFVQQFWLIVLPPSYACYAAVAFVQTLPPRSVEQSVRESPESRSIRKFNLGIILHASIQINTFPSAHAAASMAVALALLYFAPAAGWIFLWIAISIGIAAAVGRYHFTADVVLGTAIALFWFLIYRFVVIRTHF